MLHVRYLVSYVIERDAPALRFRSHVGLDVISEVEEESFHGEGTP